VPDRDPLLIALGEALRQLREERRLSQEALSLSTGVHRNYIGGIERGERQPTVAAVARLAQALDCRMSELFALAESVLDAN
jgi:transcriptional regulator with XRE-family HTH domain